jgi:hypothetical protein
VSVQVVVSIFVSQVVCGKLMMGVADIEDARVSRLMLASLGRDLQEERLSLG